MDFEKIINTYLNNTVNKYINSCHGNQERNLVTKTIKDMKTNEDLQRDVQNVIKWESLLTFAQIGVTAKERWHCYFVGCGRQLC